jgi:glycosyltransferase involved in cell wall biosynthesis
MTQLANIVSENDFPAPPVEVTGWPWTEGVYVEKKIQQGGDWPKISIVTPNYEGAETLEKTIRSVLLQQYPNLEFIIIDGGSTDNSNDIIKKYNSWITYWESEKDRGQSHALNKAFARCTGEIVNWLCSDDILLPGALHKVVEYFRVNPNSDVVVGQGRVVFASGQPDIIGGTTIEAINRIPVNNPVCQPACFYRRTLLDRNPPLVESYHYAMDFELWAYFCSKNAHWLVVDDIFCEALMTGDNKCSTGGAAITSEMIRVYRAYVDEMIPLTFWYKYLRLPLTRFRIQHPGRLAYLLARPLQILAVVILGPFYGFERVRKMNFIM